MEESIDKIKIVILSSLLHDLGKFIGRSEGQRSEMHQKLGEEFLGSLAVDEPKKSIIQSVARIIGAHHNPEMLQDEQERKIAYIIQLSDWLSSTERIQIEVGIDVPRWDQNLVSVFEIISLDGTPRNIKYDEASKFPLKALSFKRDIIFPSKQPTSDGYTEMYNEFMQELLLFLKEYDLKGSIGPLLSILEKYFWSTPSATYSKIGSYLPDVSLYDHSRITSAVALSLYRGEPYKKDENYIKEILNALKYKKDFDVPLFTMIHGDFSGIQRFITNISSKLAAKSLKGRSTGLVIMQRLIMEHFLKKLGLDLPNALYSGGGHFYLIAPYRSDKKEIYDIQDEINKFLYGHFELDLYLSIGTFDVHVSDFYNNEGIASTWRKLSESVSEDKKAKFRNLGYQLFNPKGVGGLVSTCNICGKEIGSGQSRQVGRYEICDDCYGFVDLAEYLKDASRDGYIEVSKLKEKVSVFGKFETLTEDRFALDFSHNFDKEGNRFYTVFTLPLGFPIGKDGTIREFDELAEDSYKRTGTRKIGIFKADVDNLGKIFIRGLGQGEKSLSTLSRISTLSRLFSIFFEGYINTLRNKEEYRDSIYLIYSGGDDILAIGSWDRIITFAETLYEDFKEFVCYNEGLTMSASIVITSPHTSLRSLFREAEEKLEEAKELESVVNGKVVKKSAINILGEKLYWDGIKKSDNSEFERALLIAEEIKGILSEESEESVSKSLLITRTRFLASFAYNKLKEGKLDSELLSVLWLMRYFWYRNILSKDNVDERVKKVSEDISSILKSGIFEEKNDKALPGLRDLIVGLRLAELSTRNKESEIVS
jgi:CRISPR-associated protein Csm1